MRTTLSLLLMAAFAACASAEEKQRRLDSVMIEEAKADAQAEREFLEDSTALAQTITVDTIRELRVESIEARDDVGDVFITPSYRAIAPNGAKCVLRSERFNELHQGDTLSCQWAMVP
jgi:hypothetical protein